MDGCICNYNLVCNWKRLYLSAIIGVREKIIHPFIYLSIYPSIHPFKPSYISGSQQTACLLVRFGQFNFDSTKAK